MVWTKEWWPFPWRHAHFKDSSLLSNRSFIWLPTWHYGAGRSPNTKLNNPWPPKEFIFLGFRISRQNTQRQFKGKLKRFISVAFLSISDPRNLFPSFFLVNTYSFSYLNFMSFVLERPLPPLSFGWCSSPRPPSLCRSRIWRSLAPSTLCSGKEALAITCVCFLRKVPDWMP